MHNLRIRCRSCGKELEGYQNKTVSCGCPNMATIRGDKVSAVDLSLVIMLTSKETPTTKKGILSQEDILWQEERRKRKVRKLDFEVR